jgi:cytoskeletal protein RodZ
VETGQRLAEARQRRKLTLTDISRTTKIPVSLLQAIERNDEKRLPQEFFRRAFVRTYALEVGVNPDELLDSSEIEYVEPVTVSSSGSGTRESASLMSFLLVAAGAACIIYFGYVLQRESAARPQTAAAPIEQSTGSTSVSRRGDIMLPAVDAVMAEVIEPPRATTQNARRDVVVASAAASVNAPAEAAAPVAETAASGDPSVAAPVVSEQPLPILSDAVLPQPDVTAPAPAAPEPF